jgi:hypothetical protein
MLESVGLPTAARPARSVSVVPVADAPGAGRRRAACFVWVVLLHRLSVRFARHPSVVY